MSNIEEPQVIDTELPAMTGAELKATRENLGLSTAWIADKLVIGERRIQRMENSAENIPEAIIELMDEAHEHAKELTQEMVAVYRRKVKAANGAPVMLPTYRTDKHAEADNKPYPSRFYRHIAARVADACPGAILIHTDQIPHTNKPEPGSD